MECRLATHSVERDLKIGMDFREPKYRREVFMRFYDFHLKYKAHPGAVYYAIPLLFKRLKLNKEEKLWLLFLNGCTQNIVTTYLLFKEFPSIEDAKPQKIDEYIKTKYFSNQNENKKLICVPNAFPYNCEPHIKHYLIWVNPKFNMYFPDTLNYSKFDPMVTKEVHNKFGTDVNEFIFFENIMELKSVKTIRHLHIFIKHKL